MARSTRCRRACTARVAPSQRAVATPRSSPSSTTDSDQERAPPMTTTLTETDAFPAVTIPAGGEARSITSLAGAFQSLTSRTAWLIARLREFYDNTAGTGGVFALRTAASIADMKALHLARPHGAICMVP